MMRGHGATDRRAARTRIKWVAPGGIHLTLRFLGHVADDRLEALADRLLALSRQFSPFSLELSGLGVFPSARAPRVVWVGVRDPSGSLARLQAEVEDRVEAIALERETRPFSPHLTLARIEGAAPPGLTAAIERGKDLEVGVFRVESLHLIKSVLGPGGARYEDLGVWEFGGFERHRKIKT